MSAKEIWRVESPDGQVAITLQLADLGGIAGYPSGKRRLYYQVHRGSVVVLPESPLGITRRDQDLVDGLSFLSAGAVESIDESYRLLHGKRGLCRYAAREQVLTFRNAGGARLEVILRAQDDGVAFRYRFPENSRKAHTVTREATGFRLPADALVWLHPYDRSTQYSPAYETYYFNGIEAGTPSPGIDGWAFPVLFRTGDGSCWGLLTEAALDGTYCGCRLEQEARNSIYRLRFASEEEGNRTGSREPTSALPWSTPWRVIQVAGSIGGIVESTLVTDVSPPSTVKDTSWIRPGRASWSWLSDHDSPQDCEKLRSFVDLAAHMGWEYSLVDANWTIMKNGTIHDLVRYARERGVGLLLWYNSGGKHNHVSEKPRGLMFHRDIRRKEFQLLKEWGIRGVKVDFFQSDKQNIIQLYLDILKDAADFQIMVNFHGCTLPRGWTRTYPHLMSMEAVRGAECYSFDRRFPEMAPTHNTIIPFTRNVVGPMDYTPVLFEDVRYRHLTTYAHELALSVVFESGWIHFADRVRAYRSLATGPRDFLKVLPAAWDETRCLAGEPGKLAVLARRRGKQWFLGGLNGEKNSRSIRLDLSFLGEGSHTLTIHEDGRDGKTINSRSKTVRADDALPVEMQGFGGFAARLRPE